MLRASPDPDVAFRRSALPTAVMMPRQVASMLHKRGSHATAACQGKLYAMGGWDSADFLSTVEVMDPRMNVWQVCMQPQWALLHGPIIP